MARKSFLEARSLRTVFNTQAFKRLVPQHVITLEGCTYRLDLYDPVTRTAFEMDSDKHHDGRGNRLRDIRRDAHLATAGILTVRFPYVDVMNAPHECRRIALEVMNARAPRVVART